MVKTKSIYISSEHHTALVHASQEKNIFMDAFVEKALEADPIFKKWFAKRKG